MKFPDGLKERLLSRRFLLKSLLYFAIFLLVVSLFDTVVMPFYTKHGQEFELPDVTEKPFSDAREILISNGFVPVLQDSVYDSHYPPGYVIRQNPLPFATVKEGRRVYLVISIGEKPIYMPNLIGKTPQDAEFRLKEESLDVNQVFYEFSDFYPRGVVINQSIPAGFIVRPNQRVNITVSLGSPPTSQEVPNLVGENLAGVKKELEALGIRLRSIKLQFRPNLVPGTVLSQSIAPGTPLLEVRGIDLIVSTDQPLVEHPESQDDEL